MYTYPHTLLIPCMRSRVRACVRALMPASVRACMHASQVSHASHESHALLIRTFICKFTKYDFRKSLELLT